MNNSFFSRFFTRNTATKQPSILSNEIYDVFERYRKVEGLYFNNGAYNTIQRNAYLNGEWLEAIKPLRSVVNRSVEFYVTHLLAGAKLTADKPTVLDSLNQFNKWSNFDSKKNTFSRDISIYGDLFIKVTTDDLYTKVYQEEIKAENVTELEVDTRGFLTEIRIDVPLDDGKTYTEYWSNETGEEGYVSTWEHNQGINAELEKLGQPKDFAFLAEMGIDFIPIVYVKFIDVGERGVGCVAHALDKIDEANRMATRLHQMLYRYNKPLWASMANGNDAQGRPLPPPRLNTKTSDSNSKKTDDNQIDDNSIFYLPGMSKMESMIPNINYADALAILKDMMNEIELDLPELKSYSLDTTQLSGKALGLILGAAISKAKSARANLIQGLTRINEMALTIGKFYGIFPSNIGDYANGDFNHQIVCDEIFGLDAADKAALVKAYTDAGFPLASAMKEAGFDQTEIDEVLANKQNENTTQNDNLANSLLAFNKG